MPVGATIVAFKVLRFPRVAAGMVTRMSKALFEIVWTPGKYKGRKRLKKIKGVTGCQIPVVMERGGGKDSLWIRYLIWRPSIEAAKFTWLSPKNSRW